MAPSTLPPFVTRPGEQTLRGPFQFWGMRCLLCILETDAAALRDMVREQLGAVLGGAATLEPILPSVLLTLGRYAGSRSLDPVDGQHGYVPYLEAAFWVPLVVTQSTLPGLEVGHVYFYFPFLWPDDPFAVAEGREVYGFAKALGRLLLPDRPGDEGTHLLESRGFQRFGPDEAASWWPLLRVDVTEGPDEEVFDEVVQALHAIGRVWKERHSTGEHLDEALRDAVRIGAKALLGRLKLPAISIKQLRDARDTSRAVVQQVLTFDAEITHFAGAGAVETSPVTLFENDSYPVGPTLGLASPSDPWATFWLQMSFQIGAARVVFER